MTWSPRKKISWDDPETKESHPDKSLARHIQEIRKTYELLRSRYDPPIDPSLMRWAEEIIDKVIEYHDMGKLHPDWSVHQDRRTINHSEMSIRWILDHLPSLGMPNIDTREFWLITYLILKHHSRLSKPALTGIRDRELKTFLEEYFEPVMALDGVSLFDILLDLSFEEAVVLADLYGMFKVADMFSALDICVADIDPSLRISIDKVKDMLSENGSLDMNRFNSQKKLVNAADITLLRAYTGWGKTTASILYAVSSGRRRVFYILPTITAINKFYERMCRSFGDVVGKYFYLYEWEKGSERDIDDDLVKRDLLNTLMIERLFLRYPITITTIDQLILTFLRIFKYHLRRFSFYNSVLIFDEVHLYTPRLMALLLLFLRQFHRIYRLRTLIMSATLPTPLIDYIKEYLGAGGTRVDVFDHRDGYMGRRRVMYEVRDGSIFDVLDEVVRRYERGESVLVILNTVDRAVEAAHLLRDKLGGDGSPVVLLHSRYMYVDRERIERQVEGLVRSGRPHIFVSTQVSEVSLDISYSYLYTEAAPLSSIIQRFGRVNRRGEHGTVIDRVNATILTKVGGNGGDSGNEYAPYSKYEVLETIDVLREYEGDKLRNELQLLEEYDERFDIEEYLKELGSKRLESLLRENGYLIALDLSEESVKKLIDYRNKDSVLAIPNPETMIIDDEDRKHELSRLIETLSSPGLPYEDRRVLLTRLKGYLVPMPIYFLTVGGRWRGFPIVDMDGYVYSPYYGLANVEVIEYVH